MIQQQYHKLAAFQFNVGQNNKWHGVEFESYHSINVIYNAGDEMMAERI